MKRVVIVQHDPADSPGTVPGVLAAHGLGVDLVRPFAGQAVPPAVGGWNGLVVLGGPMGVSEQDRHPFLTDELRLIRSAVAAGVPVLGLCLGCQLLAAALGGAVRPHARKEVGWHPVTLLPAAAGDPVWAGLPSPFPAFHWHGDTFDLPPGSTLLASSAACRHQAFRHGASAYGVQFHLEVNADKVGEMAAAFPGPLEQVGLTGHRIVQEAVGFLPAMGAVAGAVFGRWADMVT